MSTAEAREANIPKPVQERLIACLDLIGRTGAKLTQVRYSDDEEPVVWMVTAGYERKGDPKSGSPAKRVDRTIWECAAAITPDIAALRLVEILVDGGECQHCKRPSGVTEDWTEKMPLDDLICWYQYDPELKTFRRSCELADAA